MNEYISLFYGNYIYLIIAIILLIISIIQLLKTKKDSKGIRIAVWIFTIFIFCVVVLLSKESCEEIKKVNSGSKILVGELIERKAIPHSPQYKSPGEYFVFKDMHNGEEVRFENKHGLSKNRFEETLYSNKLYKIVYYDFNMIVSIETFK